MNYYILGAAGMLGREVQRYFREQGHDVLATDIEQTDCDIKFCDIRSLHSMLYQMEEFKPDVIINLAAKTNLEWCELHRFISMETNAIGSANCALLANMFDIPYVYVSTAGIFDGEQREYFEWDIPNPLNVYGSTKLAGERFAQTARKHIIMRCGWQMGSGEHDKKFINLLWKQLLAGAASLDVVADKFGAPTYVKDFTRQMDVLISQEKIGTWNAVCDTKFPVSRYDVAVEFIKVLGLENEITVNPVNSKFFENEYFATRPYSECLLPNKLKAVRAYVMRPWQDALRDYVKVDNADYFSLEKLPWMQLKIAS